MYLAREQPTAAKLKKTVSWIPVNVYSIPAIMSGILIVKSWLQYSNISSFLDIFLNLTFAFHYSESPSSFAVYSYAKHISAVHSLTSNRGVRSWIASFPLCTTLMIITRCFLQLVLHNCGKWTLLKQHDEKLFDILLYVHRYIATHRRGFEMSAGIVN